MIQETRPLKIFIGFDQVESVAYHTLCQSILSRSSVPVSFIPVKRSHLKKIHTRPLDPKQSNEFSFTRFLVPYLSEYSGWSLFMDSDMIVRCDIKELFDLKDYSKSVMCVKHDYTPSSKTKYLGNIQYKYEKKNWSSVILFNNARCRKLTPEYINKASGLDLHQFKWLDNPDLAIGELPKEFNHLVTDMPPNKDAKIVHYTVGTPCFNEYQHCEYANEWFEERALANNAIQMKDLKAS